MPGLNLCPSRGRACSRWAVTRYMEILFMSHERHLSLYSYWCKPHKCLHYETVPKADSEKNDTETTHNVLFFLRVLAIFLF